jgi:hypothetical protein
VSATCHCVFFFRMSDRLGLRRRVPSPAFSCWSYCSVSLVLIPRLPVGSLVLKLLFFFLMKYQIRVD